MWKKSSCCTQAFPVQDLRSFPHPHESSLPVRSCPESFLSLVSGQGCGRQPRADASVLFERGPPGATSIFQNLFQAHPGLLGRRRLNPEKQDCRPGSLPTADPGTKPSLSVSSALLHPLSRASFRVGGPSGGCRVDGPCPFSVCCSFLEIPSLT